MALLYEKGLNGILADEMGLGKTIQVRFYLRNYLQVQHCQLSSNFDSDIPFAESFS